MRRSTFTLVLLWVSLVGFALLALLYYLDSADGGVAVEYSLALRYSRAWYLFLAGCALNALLLFVAGSVEFARILLAAQTFAVLLFQHYFGFVRFFELPIALLTILPAAVYQSVPSNAITCGVFVLITTLFRGETLRDVIDDPRELLVNQGVYVMVTASFAAVTSLVTRYRETVINYQNQVDELREVGARLAEANLSVQNYAHNVRESTLSQERKRLTREVHDIVGYLVTNVSMAFEAIRLMSTREPESIPELATQAREQVEAGLQDMRAVLHDLRSKPVGRVSGVYSIRRLVQTFSGATGIDVRLEYGNVTLSYDDIVQTIIYRFIQEGMINAFRHGRATRIVIQFWQSDTNLTVTVWDDGSAPDQIQEGIGIAGMRERLELVSGELAIDLIPEGFRISISIPLAAIRVARGVDPRSASANGSVRPSVIVGEDRDAE